MAATFTVTNSTVMGNKRAVWGTFTTADGDTSVALGASTHGLNNIVDYKLTLDSGGLQAEQPKVSISSGTVTATFSDTKGWSGKFYVLGS